MSVSKQIETKPDISIVICTYNPEERIFSRLLSAVQSLIIPENITFECVIVDNNSTPALIESSYIKDFLESCSTAKIITETKQGLSFARIAGFKSTTAPVIVFFDDDNEPDKYYIKGVKSIFDNYTNVAVWGPGKVSVEFIDPVSDWFARNFKNNFQEKYISYPEYGCARAKWEKFYPSGTGLAFKRKIFEKYYQNFLSGQLSNTDRQGNNLSSGGDIQIVWEAIKMGFAAGISPDLKINHIIPGKRANLQYIRRLNFGVTVSYRVALTQSFATEKEKIISKRPYTSNAKIILNIIRIIILRIGINNNDTWKEKYNLIFCDLAGYLGQVVGGLRASNSTEKEWVYELVKLLKIE